MSSSTAGIEIKVGTDQLSGVVIEYVSVLKHVFDKAKQPGFSVDSWAPLARLVAVDEFEWAGPFSEVLKWQAYIEFLTQWARTVSWDSVLRRIHQWQGLVYFEHDEQSTIGDTVDVARSLSIFEFNEAGKIRRLEVYLQRPHSLGL